MPVGYVPFGTVVGFDFDPGTGTFYVADSLASGNNRLFALNVITGDATPAPSPSGAAFGFSGLAVAPRERCPPRTYTLDADFKLGTIVNLNHDNPAHDQLQLNPTATPLPYLAVACSARGTVVRINVNTGAIVGEYLSAPVNMSHDPSRTTVEKYGSVWVANRGENSQSGGQLKGSVVRIGLLIGGTRYDKISGIFVQNLNGL